MEQRKTLVSRHPFSVESLISCHKTSKDFERRREEDVFSQSAKPEIRDSCGSAGIQKHFMQTSPVKSESPEPDDCTPWVMNSRFAQTRKQFHFLNCLCFKLNINYDMLFNRQIIFPKTSNLAHFIETYKIFKKWQCYLLNL